MTLLSEVTCQEFSFDFIGLTEIFQIHDFSDYNIEGYHPLIYKTRPSNQSNRGGVGLYINKRMKFKQRDDLSIFIPHIFESIFIEVKSINGDSYVIGNIYRPNSPPHADMDIFNEHLSEIIEKVNQERKKIIIMGDFNIDLLNYLTHAKTNDFVEGILSQGLFPLITKPTRVTEDSATIIDHIHTNIIDKENISGIIITDVSDHFGTFTIFNKKCTEKNNENVPTRIFSQNNINAFNRILQQSNYTTIMNCRCANEAYAKFQEIYIAAYDLAFPVKYNNKRNKYLKRKPWMTAGLIKSSHTKQKLYLQKIKRHHAYGIEKYNKIQ